MTLSTGPSVAKEARLRYKNIWKQEWQGSHTDFTKIWFAAKTTLGIPQAWRNFDVEKVYTLALDLMHKE